MRNKYRKLVVKKWRTGRYVVKKRRKKKMIAWKENKVKTLEESNVNYIALWIIPSQVCLLPIIQGL